MNQKIKRRAHHEEKESPEQDLARLRSGGIFSVREAELFLTLQFLRILV